MDNQSVHKAHENASAEFISLMAALLFLQTDKSCVLTEQQSDIQKSYHSAEYVEKKRIWWRERGVKFHRSLQKSHILTILNRKRRSAFLVLCTRFFSLGTKLSAASRIDE